MRRKASGRGVGVAGAVLATALLGCTGLSSPAWTQWNDKPSIEAGLTAAGWRPGLCLTTSVTNDSTGLMCDAEKGSLRADIVLDHYRSADAAKGSTEEYEPGATFTQSGPHVLSIVVLDVARAAAIRDEMTAHGHAPAGIAELRLLLQEVGWTHDCQGPTPDWECTIEREGEVASLLLTVDPGASAAFGTSEARVRATVTEDTNTMTVTAPSPEAAAELAAALR